jgi:ubiquinone/menaquinone biosynthesis C-methylase UbiE
MRGDSFAGRAATYSDSVWHAELAEAFARWLGLGPGLTVVDVGTGTGFAALAVDGQDRTRVHGVDLSRAMVEVARERAETAGRGGVVSFAVGDGHRLGVRDQCADAVLFVTSLQYMEAGRALGEARRIVRPGGTVAIGTLAAETMGPSVVYRRLLAEHGVETPDRMGAIGSPGRLTALLSEAGLSDVETGQDVLRLADADLADAWPVSAVMYARRLAGLDLDALRERYEAQVAAALAEDEDGFRAITMLMARARRPDR